MTSRQIVSSIRWAAVLRNVTGFGVSPASCATTARCCWTVGGSVCYPPDPAWDRLTQIFLSAQQVDGADTFIGRRLPELFRRAGLVDIGVEAKADIYPAGNSRRTIRADLVRSMRPKILAAGIASEHELDKVDQAVREHLCDPDTLMLPHLLILAWGRKPADAAADVSMRTTGA
jgi:hypothetical protein